MRATPELRGRGIARSTILYAGGAVAGKVAGVVLLPILARGLGPSDYGLFDIISTIGSTLTVVLLLGLDSAATRFASGRDERTTASVFSTWLLIAMAVGATAAVTIAITSSVISGAAVGSGAATNGLRLLAVIVPAGIVNLVGLTALRVQARAGWYAMVVGGSLVLNAILAALAVGPMQLGPSGAIGAWLVAVTCSAVLTIVLSGVRPRWQVDPVLARRLLSFGLPLVPAIAIALGAEVAHRLILLTVVGADAVGVLSVATRLASVVGLIGVATNLAWVPMTYAASAGGQVDQRVLRPAVRAIGIMLAVAIATSWMAAPAASVLAGPGFETVTAAIGPLAIGAAAMGALPLVGIGSAIAFRSSEIASATILGASIGVMLSVILVPRFGLTGSAMSIGIGQVISVVVMASLARRHAMARVPFTRLAAAAAVASIAVIGLTVGSLDGAIAAAWMAGCSALAVSITWMY